MKDEDSGRVWSLILTVERVLDGLPAAMGFDGFLRGWW